MDLDQLSNLLVNVGSPHQVLVQDLGEPVVYHYTDLNALRSIVSDGDLWLTNSRFSNDYEEGEHGKKVVSEALARRAGEQYQADGAREFSQQVRRILDASADDGVYVCCFCRADDLLGQWRSYGANGTGVSVGFATSGFQEITGPDMSREQFGLMYLWRVFYEPQMQLKIVDDCLDMALLYGEGSDEDKVALAADALRFFVPTFKNQDFAEEREARLVFWPSPTCSVKPRFRIGRGMLVPYYSLQELAGAAGQLEWRPPITSVRVGPSANKAINREGVELLLTSSLYEDVTVDTSDTPYRG